MGNANSASAKVPENPANSGNDVSPNAPAGNQKAAATSNGGSGGGYHFEPLKAESSDDSTKNLKRPGSRTNTTRRTASCSPSGSERSTDSISLPSLHGSLMRAQKRRDPHRFYDVVKVLGDGSMGSVSKVQKRKSVVGGSARTDFVYKEKLSKRCFGFPLFCFFCPIFAQEDSKDMLATIEELNEEFSEEGQTIENSSNNDTDNDELGSLSSRAKKLKKYAAHPSDSASSIVTYDEKKNVTLALKSIHLDRVKDSVFRQELMNEIAILQRLDHPHIVKAIETFDYHNRLYLVLELCSGGDLYARDPYDEAQACSIVCSIVDAVAYMHSKDITHRDLKFENIMFATPTSYTIKIIDFGLSKKYAHEEHLHDTVGTVYTMAPEVLKGDYDNKVDLWSIGVIAFMLLSSSLPFYGKTRQHVVRRILHCKYAFKGKRWNSVSEKAKEFIKDLLVLDPQKRPTAAEALNTSWLCRNAGVDAPISFALMDRVQATIQTFAGYGRLKKLALMVIAYKSTEEEIGFLRKIFGYFDSVRDGEIEFEEFKSALSVYHYTDCELEKMFVAMDLDGTGKVHYSEFLAATIEAHGTISEERIAEAFDRLDGDDSGCISVDDLKAFLGNEISEEYANAIIDEADLNHDHEIEYKEFLGLWDDTYDARLRNALKDITKRRETFDETSCGGMSRSSSFSEDLDGSTMSATSSDLGGGGYFFDMEKEKSMRGVWV